MTQDKITLAITKDGAARIYTATTTELVNYAQKIHKSFPTATAALGRALTAASMMGSMIKQDNGSISLQFKGNGKLGTVFAIGEPDGSVRGYCHNPQADLPLNSKGKLDVGGGIGEGTLTIIRNIGVGEPYVGQIPLVSGEIAEDLTYYYAQSEQTPTVVALGVLVDTDLSVKAAGGYIIQMMPGFGFDDEKIISSFEEKINTLPSVSTMVSNGLTSKDIMLELTKGLDIDILQEITPKYKCNCSLDRVERALISLGEKELNKIIEEDQKAEICCTFCDKKYQFSLEDLQKLKEKAKKH